MSIQNLMNSMIDVFRPVYSEGTTQQLVAYSQVYACLAANIQPMTYQEAFWFNQRGLEGMLTIYTTATNATFQRQDIIRWYDLNAVEHQFHVVGIKNALFRDLYIELTASEWPTPAKKILDLEQTLP